MLKKLSIRAAISARYPRLRTFLGRDTFSLIAETLEEFTFDCAPNFGDWNTWERAYSSGSFFEFLKLRKLIIIKESLLGAGHVRPDTADMLLPSLVELTIIALAKQDDEISRKAVDSRKMPGNIHTVTLHCRADWGSRRVWFQNPHEVFKRLQIAESRFLSILRRRGIHLGLK